MGVWSFIDSRKYAVCHLSKLPQSTFIVTLSTHLSEMRLFPKIRALRFLTIIIFSYQTNVWCQLLLSSLKLLALLLQYTSSHLFKLRNKIIYILYDIISNTDGIAKKFHQNEIKCQDIETELLLGAKKAAKILNITHPFSDGGIPINWLDWEKTFMDDLRCLTLGVILIFIDGKYF